MKEVLVFSLGGSLIVPGNVNYEYLHKFKKFILKLTKNYKVVIVTGGGKTARKYIEPLIKEKVNEYLISLVGIMSTKLNARLVSGILNLKYDIPDNLKEVKKLLDKNNVVVCGALGVQPNMTSDGDAAQISEYLTNVDGLYDKDPRKYKDAKFIHEVNFNDFIKISNQIKYKAGQHFILDQAAAQIINRAKIKTLIINGKKLENVTRFLNNDDYRGTLIS